jgi:nitroreductase
MQQFAAAARSQHRPPLVLTDFAKKSKDSSKSTSPTIAQRPASSLSHHNLPKDDEMSSMVSKFRMSSIEPSFPTIRPLSSVAHTTSDAGANASATKIADYKSFQSMIKDRRTTSNYSPIPIHMDISQITRLQDAMKRAIACATTAPNHHRTEPTTYYRILAHTKACDHLLDICYNVSLCKNLKKKSRTMEEARISAKSKKDKWKNTIGGYLVVCVGNQPIQDDQYPYKEAMAITTEEEHELEGEDMQDDFNYWYDTIPLQPPQTERQLEDYASACASIQNILLSLHSEELGSKWASGPMIRCRAFRNLVGLEKEDAIAGLIMIGSPKVVPKPWRRKRDFDNDVIRDL